MKKLRRTRVGQDEQPWNAKNQMHVREGLSLEALLYAAATGQPFVIVVEQERQVFETTGEEIVEEL